MSTAENEPREVDLRLVLGALAAWVAVVIGLGGSQGAVAAAVVAASALAVLATIAAWMVGWRWPERIRAGLAVLALATACVAVALLALLARLHQVRDGPLAELVRAQASGVVDATVTGDPRPIGSGALVAAAPRLIVDVTVTGVRSSRQSFRLRAPAVVVTSDAGWAGLQPGQQVRFDGRLAPPWSPADLTAAAITARGQPTLIGRPPWWQRTATHVRTSLRGASAGLPAAERGLLPGLIDGDTSGLDPILEEQFKVAGLTHLVAVSGTNVALVVGAVLLVLRRAGVRPWVAAASGGLVLVAFVIVARPSPSVLRAAVMAAVVLVGVASGRPRQGLPALAVAVLTLLVWHPEWSRNAGFALSVVATTTLLIIAPGWTEALRRRHVPPVLAEGIAVAAAASLVTAPIIVLLSGQLSLVALPANVLAEFAVAPATVLGVLAAASAPFSADVGAFFAQLAGIPCRWLVATAGYFGTRPGATLAWPATTPGLVLLASLTVLVAVACRIRALRRPLIAAAVAALVIQFPIRALTLDWPVTGTILVACDVGQGDGLAIPVGDGRAVVIDSGPDPVAIDRCLRSLGITRVPLYIQTHLHQDHVGGIEGVLRNRQLDAAWTGPLRVPAAGLSLLTRALSARGITAQVPPVGQRLTVGDAQIEVLASHTIDVDGEPDPNDSSLVVRATVAGRTIMLLGDASTAAQQWLLQQGLALRSDVLKVAHHGSAYFEPALYAAVHARVAVISVGAGNRYGHPSPRVLTTLAQLGVPVARTDLDGDVAVAGTADHGLRTVYHRHATTAAPAGGPIAPPGRPTTSCASTSSSGCSPSSEAAGPARSSPRATMGSWPPDRTQLTERTTAASSSSSVTRNFWSTGPSRRSPRPGAGPMPPPMWSSSRDPPSSRPSCTRC